MNLKNVSLQKAHEFTAALRDDKQCNLLVTMVIKVV